MHPRIRASSAAGELCHAWSWLWCRLVLQRPVPVLPVPGSQESARNGVAQPGQKLSSKWTSASQSTSPAPPDAAGPFQSFAPPSSLTAARLGRVWSPPRRLSFWFLFRRPLSSLATSRRRPTHAPPARCRSSRKRRHAHCRPAWTKPADSRDERRQPVRSDRDRHASSDQQQQRQPACQRISVGVTDSPGLPCLPCFSSVPLSSVFPLRGVLPPSSVAPSLVSSLPSQAAHLASLAWVPPSELEVRKHTDHFRPLIEKEHSTVYWDKKGQSSTGYLLRPNFRQLHESDDPASHRSLTFVTSVPPSLRASLHAHTNTTTAHQPTATDSLVASRKPRAKSPPALASTDLTDQLIFLRAPRRGLEEERRKAAKLAKERQEDYDHAGLKARPIKSVAALLATAPGAKKPTHLRLTSIAKVGDTVGGSADEKQFLASPNPLNGANLARFAKALKLPSKGSSAHAPPPIQVPFGVDGAEEDFAPADLTSGLAESDAMRSRPPASVASPLVSASLLAFPSSGGPLVGASSSSAGFSSEDGPAKVGVVVAAEQGATCCICTSSDFVEPWISQCKHVCCSECWMQYLKEDPTCPECSVPVNVEELRPIVLCAICTHIPTDPWTSPCGHTACEDCWRMYLLENPVCSECAQPIDLKQLPNRNNE